MADSFRGEAKAISVRLERRGLRKASSSFLKKKNQKNFSTLDPGFLLTGQPAATRPKRAKSFFASFSLHGAFAGVLSQKEDSCLSSAS
jgi:hypothetical protein